MTLWTCRESIQLELTYEISADCWSISEPQSPLDIPQGISQTFLRIDFQVKVEWENEVRINLIRRPRAKDVEINRYSLTAILPSHIRRSYCPVYEIIARLLRAWKKNGDIIVLSILSSTLLYFFLFVPCFLILHTLSFRFVPTLRWLDKSRQKTITFYFTFIEKLRPKTFLRTMVHVQQGDFSQQK